MGTGVEVVRAGAEVIGPGSDKKVAMSSSNDWVFSDSWDRAVDERENITLHESTYISHQLQAVINN